MSKILVALVLGGLVLLGLIRFLSDSSAENVTESPEEVKDVALVSIQGFANRPLAGSDFTAGRALEQHALYTRYFITYKSEGLTISGIMNVPKGEGPFPVAILNHGYIDPTVYTNGRGLRREQDFFARNNYVVIHSDYRNHAQSEDDPENNKNMRIGYNFDVANLVDAVRKANLSFMDTERIGMLGHSMGGGITMNIITAKPDLIDAAILYAPVSGDVRDNFYKWTQSRPEGPEILENFGSPEENPEFWDNISPINFVSRIKVPVMVQHGSADKETDIEWSRKFVAAMKEAGKTVTLNEYAHEGHEFGVQWTAMMQSSLEFFNTHLK